MYTAARREAAIRRWLAEAEGWSRREKLELIGAALATRPWIVSELVEATWRSQ